MHCLISSTAKDQLVMAKANVSFKQVGDGDG